MINLRIRIIGADFDISLAMCTDEDFEIVERILARAKSLLPKLPLIELPAVPTTADKP
jgi:hypothetical protein